MTKQGAEALIRKRIGEIPILQTVIQRLRWREIVLSYIKPHGNETVPAVDTRLVLVWNIACGRQPLYELPEWVAKLDSGLLGHICQLKSVHQVAPTLFKRVERVEAIMLLFFLALILQAVIERDVRRNMRASNIDALSIYPEHRLAYHPTTAKIFERFQDMSNYRVVEGNQVIKVYRDEITDLHKEILALLGMTEKCYWQKVA